MSPVHPMATKIEHVRISVAIVMPEIGFDDVPMSPVMRDDTVTKKNPKITMRIAARKFPWVGIFGATARKIASASEPTSTTPSGMSRSVRARAIAPAPAPRSFIASRNDDTIVGMVRASVMSPDARTAPAPVYRMYALHSCPADISLIISPLGGMGGNG